MNDSLSLRLAAELSILSLMLAKQAHEWTPSDEEHTYVGETGFMNFWLDLRSAV